MAASSVARAWRPSIPHGNPPFSGMISVPSTIFRYLADAARTFVAEWGLELWKLSLKKRDLANSLLRSKMRFRLAAAPSTSGRFRVLCFVRVLWLLVAQFPCPCALSAHTGMDSGAGSLACDSAVHGRCARRWPRSGASSTIFDIDWRTSYFRSVTPFFIDRHFILISCLTPSSIPTLPFQHLLRLSRRSSDDELRENQHYHQHSSSNGNGVSSFHGSFTEVPMKRLIEPGNSGFPCGIDGLRVLATVVADLLIVGNCTSGLEKSRMPQNKWPGYITRFLRFATKLTRLWLPFVLISK